MNNVKIPQEVLNITQEMPKRKIEIKMGPGQEKRHTEEVRTWEGTEEDRDRIGLVARRPTCGNV
jgi:hypothetical protein